MSVVSTTVPATVGLADLTDGQIAEIANWPFSNRPGQVVQRYHDDLVVLGGDSIADSIPLFFTSGLPVDYSAATHNAIVLGPGSTLAVV